MAKYHNKNVALNKPHYATGKDAVHHKSVVYVKDGNHVKRCSSATQTCGFASRTGAPRLVQGTPPLLQPGAKDKAKLLVVQSVVGRSRAPMAAAPVRALFTRRRIRKAYLQNKLVSLSAAWHGLAAPAVRARASPSAGRMARAAKNFLEASIYLRGVPKGSL